MILDVGSVCPFCKVKHKSANHYNTYSVLIIIKYTLVKKKKTTQFLFEMHTSVSYR